MMLLLPKATTETPVESLCKRNQSQHATQTRDAPLTLPPHGNIRELIQFTKFQYSQHQPVLPFIHIHQHSCNLMNKTWSKAIQSATAQDATNTCTQTRKINIQSTMESQISVLTETSEPPMKTWVRPEILIHRKLLLTSINGLRVGTLPDERADTVADADIAAHENARAEAAQVDYAECHESYHFRWLLKQLLQVYLVVEEESSSNRAVAETSSSSKNTKSWPPLLLQPIQCSSYSC